jgi:hypothetical protein
MKPKDLFKSVHLVFVSMVLYLRSLIIQTTEVNCSLKSLSTRLDPHPFPVPLGRGVLGLCPRSQWHHLCSAVCIK